MTSYDYRESRQIFIGNDECVTMKTTTTMIPRHHHTFYFLLLFGLRKPIVAEMNKLCI